jgi:hypothetical protein
MNKIFIVFISFLLFSCNINSTKTFDSSKIIGQKFSSDILPYSDFYLDGYKYINGIHYRVMGTDYKNKALIYVLEKSHIIDCFFSNTIRLYKAKKISLETDYEEVVKKFGEPAFLEYPDILYDFDYGNQGNFRCQYFERYFDKISLKYRLTQNMVTFYFNSAGKLEKTDSVWEWRP